MSSDLFGRGLAAFACGVDKAANVLTGVAGFNDEVLLAQAGFGCIKEGLSDARTPFFLAVEIRHCCAQLGHRLLLIHKLMMPHGCGHPESTTEVTFIWPLT